MTRQEAMRRGLKRYENGKPCPQGHTSARYVSTGHCVECLATNAKAWRTDNPEKVKQYTQKYYEANSQSLNEKSRDWHDKNKDAHRALNVRWHKENPAGRCAHEARRRALKARIGGTHTYEEIAELLAKQHGKCVICLRSIAKKYHVDHFMPLALGGSNNITNIQLLCPPCNQRKHKKDPFEFAKQNQRLI